MVASRVTGDLASSVQSLGIVIVTGKCCGRQTKIYGDDSSVGAALDLKNKSGCKSQLKTEITARQTKVSVMNLNCRAIWCFIFYYRNVVVPPGNASDHQGDCILMSPGNPLMKSLLKSPQATP